MEIHITIRSGSPLTGIAQAERGEPVAFAGWVELLRAISALLGNAGVGDSVTDAAPAARDAAADAKEDVS